MIDMILLVINYNASQHAFLHLSGYANFCSKRNLYIFTINEIKESENALSWNSYQQLSITTKKKWSILVRISANVGRHLLISLIVRNVLHLCISFFTAWKRYRSNQPWLIFSVKKWISAKVGRHLLIALIVRNVLHICMFFFTAWKRCGSNQSWLIFSVKKLSLRLRISAKVGRHLLISLIVRNMLHICFFFLLHEKGMGVINRGYFSTYVWP